YFSGRSRPSLSTARLMTCQRTVTSRTCSTSPIQRLVIQAQGHTGSNQKSATRTSLPVAVVSVVAVRVTGRVSFVVGRRSGGPGPSVVRQRAAGCPRGHPTVTTPRGRSVFPRALLRGCARSCVG